MRVCFLPIGLPLFHLVAANLIYFRLRKNVFSLTCRPPNRVYYSFCRHRWNDVYVSLVARQKRTRQSVSVHINVFFGTFPPPWVQREFEKNIDSADRCILNKRFPYFILTIYFRFRVAAEDGDMMRMHV